MLPASELRFSYRVEGHEATPRVVVRREHGNWHASVLITEPGASLHITPPYATSDEAVAEAERLIREHYASAAITRLR